MAVFPTFDKEMKRN